jgi:hypothetical protein
MPKRLGGFGEFQEESDDEGGGEVGRIEEVEEEEAAESESEEGEEEEEEEDAWWEKVIISDEPEHDLVRGQEVDSSEEVQIRIRQVCLVFPALWCPRKSKQLDRCLI